MIRCKRKVRKYQFGSLTAYMTVLGGLRFPLVENDDGDRLLTLASTEARRWFLEDMLELIGLRRSGAAKVVKPEDSGLGLNDRAEELEIEGELTELSTRRGHFCDWPRLLFEGDDDPKNDLKWLTQYEEEIIELLASLSGGAVATPAPATEDAPVAEAKF